MIWEKAFTVDFWVHIYQSALSQAIYVAWDIVKIAAFYFVARFVLAKLVDRVAFPIIAYERTGEDEGRLRRVRTLQTLVKSVISYVLFFVAAVMALRSFHVDPLPVLTAAGVVGLAIGFGAQKLVRDVISGFFVILENQYAVGEYVTVSGVTGTVNDVGMRTTSIRGDDGKLYVLSNGSVDLICNHSRGSVETGIDVTISAEEDVERVVGILNDLGQEFIRTTRKLESPFRVVGVSSFTAGAVTIRIEARGIPPALEEVQMAFREKVRQRLIEAGVKLA